MTLGKFDNGFSNHRAVPHCQCRKTAFRGMVEGAFFLSDVFFIPVWLARPARRPTLLAG